MLHSRNNDSIRKTLQAQKLLTESWGPPGMRPQVWKQTDHPSGGYVSTTKDYRGSYETAHVHPERGATVIGHDDSEADAERRHAQALKQSF